MNLLLSIVNMQEDFSRTANMHIPRRPQQRREEDSSKLKKVVADAEHVLSATMTSTSTRASEKAGAITRPLPRQGKLAVRTSRPTPTTNPLALSILSREIRHIFYHEPILIYLYFLRSIRSVMASKAATTAAVVSAVCLLLPYPPGAVSLD